MKETNVTPSRRFYSLYGHLGKSHFHLWKKGMVVKMGDEVASIGPREENGGWIPHLHFQIILDMEGKEGDYPGVSSRVMLDHYRSNCPDPEALIKRGYL